MLHPLSEAPGGLLRARELGTEIGWDRSRLSHHLTRMEKRGLVAREECAEDGRGLDGATDRRRPKGDQGCGAGARRERAAAYFFDLPCRTTSSTRSLTVFDRLLDNLAERT